MKASTCPSCNVDTRHYPYLPDKFPWSRDKHTNYFVLKCDSCGSIYCFSVRQFLAIFILQTFLLAILLVIYNVGRFVIPASFAVIYWGSQCICKYVWCSLAWEKIRDISVVKPKRIILLLGGLMLLSFPAALLLVVSIF